MRKEIDRVFTVFVFQVMGWRHGTCEHFVALRGLTRGVRGTQFPWCRITMGAPNHCGERRMAVGAPKSPNIVTSTFFNTVHLLPKDLSFEHGTPNVLLAPGAIKRRYALIALSLSRVHSRFI